ncbi:hypothetical protein Patl1_15264 [Pistacia atlantica]|uniref:Uncharacterized protein n=1 Tax=Pistacia atlantica TaxID=434234 RepID=A0ACC1B6I7_9ROSI|nr:hypothetical protein Patl1_15264 [Pistacia atlantica]
MIWDNPPKMVHSGAVFETQFQKNDPVLNIVDEKILNHGRNQAVPGAWCSG